MRRARHRASPDARPGAVPRRLAQERVGRRCRVPPGPRPAPRRTRATKLGGVSAIRDQPLLAVRPHDVADRRRDDRLAGGQVLGRLGRADEPRRLVARERQQRHVPAGDVVRAARRRSSARGSGCSGAAAAPAGSILTTGPTSTICQSGRARGDAVEQREVHALVDHAEEAEPRARDRAPGRRIGARPARACAKCATSTLLGNGCTFGCGSRFASYSDWPPVNTRSARRSSSRLALSQRRAERRERGQLVHAVVDDRERRQMVGERAAPSACSTTARSLSMRSLRDQAVDRADAAVRTR